MVVHSDCGDDVTSNVVTVTVNPATAITAQPSNATVCYSETDNLSVTATGTGTVTYAWKYSSDGGANWSAASGTNNTATYAISTNLAAGGSHKFKVVVHSDCGDDVTSDVVTVTVNPLTAITSQPSNATVCYGGTTNLSVTATGAGTVTYAWKYSSDGGSNWSAASGTNNAATYAIPTNLAAGGSHKFKVIVHSDCGDDVTSNVATVTVNALPTVTINGGTGLTLYGASVELTAAGASTYAWSPSTELDDDDVAVVTATASETRTYTVTGTDANGCENTATVTIVPFTDIIVSGSTTFCYGETRTLTVNDNNDWTDYAWYTNTTSDDIDDDVWGSSISSNRAYTTAANLAVGTHYFYCTSPTDGANTGVVTLVVTPLTAISSQPSNATVCYGGTSNLSVTATGTGTVTYAWKYSSDGGSNWSAASGTNNAATYAIPTNLAAGGSHKFKVVVHSDCGDDVTSNVVTVTVNPATAISAQPSNATVCYGETDNLSVTASGTGTVTYAWKYSSDGGSNWSSASGTNNAATYAIPTNLAAGGSHKFKVVVHSDCGDDVTSDVVTVTVNPLTAITSQPSNATVCYGGTTNLSVTATGAGTVTYAWKYSSDNGVNWAAASGTNNAATYAIPTNLALGDGHKYKVIVGSDCGDDVTSNVVTVTVTPATAITSQPSDATVYYGETTNLSVTATGAGLFTYTWQYSSNNGASWSNASGTNNAVTYTIPTNLAIGGNHKFRVLVHNDCGDDVISNAATITVIPLLRFSEDPCATPISTVEELKAALASGDGSYYLENDLWLDGESWPSGKRNGYQFKGTLDGRDHTIHNLTIANYESPHSGICVGFLAYLSPCGVIENLNFQNCTVQAHAVAGMFAGVVAGTIRNCMAYQCHIKTGYSVSANVCNNLTDKWGNDMSFSSLPGAYVGGICAGVTADGVIEYSSVQDSYIDAWNRNEDDETNLSFGGGLAAWNNGQVLNSLAAWNYINYNSYHSYVRAGNEAYLTGALRYGGLLGVNEGTMRNSVLGHPGLYNGVYIAAYDSVAGLAAVNSGTISSCLFLTYTYGATSVTVADNSFLYLIGGSHRSITSCENTGTITSCHYEDVINSSNYEGTGNGYVAEATLLSGATFSETYYPYTNWVFPDGDYPLPQPVAAPTYNFNVVASSSCQRATLSLSGTMPSECMSYQWQRSIDNSSWECIEGATNPTYITLSSESTDVYYRCCIRSDGYTYMPTNGSVVVHPLPVITLPSNYYICNSGSVTLEASATNTSTYSWSPSTGLSATNVAQPTASPASTTNYTLTATSAEGCHASRSTRVFVNLVTAITSQPVNTNVCYGGTANLRVTATGSGTITYAWKYSSDNGANWSAAPGINNTALYTLPTDLAEDGNHKFKVVVHSDCGDDVTSDVVTVTVISFEDFTTDPAEPQPISNADELREALDGGTGSYYLTTDIDLDGEMWDWYDFYGTLDGRGNTISNLTWADIGLEFMGFVGVLEPCAVIQNINFSSITINGSAGVGTVAGVNFGTIRNCHVSDCIILSYYDVAEYYMNFLRDENDNLYPPITNNGGAFCGGIAGATGMGSKVEYCSVSYSQIDAFPGRTAESMGTSYIMFTGGIVGGHNGIMRNCSAEHNDLNYRTYNAVTGIYYDAYGDEIVDGEYRWISETREALSTQTRVGGLVGGAFLNSSIENSMVMSEAGSDYIIGYDYIGGLAGQTWSRTEVNNCLVLSGNGTTVTPMTFNGISPTLTHRNIMIGESGNTYSYCWYEHAHDDNTDPVTGYVSTANLMQGTPFDAVHFSATNWEFLADDYITIKNVAAPTYNFNVNASSTCQPATLSLSGTLPGGDCKRYQWQKSADNSTWENIDGATGISCVTLTTETTDMYYRCRILDDGYNYLPTNTSVLVHPWPIITLPEVYSICEGNSTTLGATTNATSYSWSPSTGLSATNVAQPTASPTTTTVYTLSATSAYSCVNNKSTTVMVDEAGIATQPANTSVCFGVSDDLSVVAVGEEPLTYKWKYSNDNGDTWSDAAGTNDEDIYALPTNLAVGDGHKYKVEISSACGATTTSDVVTVMVNPLRPITVQPTNLSLCNDESGNFIVTAAGPNLTYWWERSYDNGETWSDANGTNNEATYTLDYGSGEGVLSLIDEDSKKFRVIVSSDCGEDTSNVVSIILYNNPNIRINGSFRLNQTYYVTRGDELELTASGADTYTWSPATELDVTTGATVTATPTVSHVYTVTGSTTTGGKTCSTAKEVNVIVRYYITVLSNNIEYGSVSGSTYVDEGDGLWIRATPNAGYHFVEWAEDGNTDSQRLLANIHDDATYTAVFASGYKVQYDGNGATSGEVPTDETNYTPGDYVIVPAQGTLRRTNAVFLGWSPYEYNVIEDAAAEEVIELYVRSIGLTRVYYIYHNTTMYAVWAIDENGNGIPDYRELTIIYNGNGETAGNVPLDATVYNKGDNAVVQGNFFAPILERTHAIFLGWTTTQVSSLVNTSTWKNSLPIYEEGDQILMTSSITLYALWAADENNNGIPDYEEWFEIEFDADSNGSLTGVTYYDDIPYGTPWGDVVVPTPVPNIGYAFLHWEDENGDEVTDFPETITDYLYYTAVFTPNTIHVTYNSNSASAGVVPVDGAAYELGDDVDLLGNIGSPALTKDGSTFIGWATSAQPVLTSLVAETALRGSGNFYEVGDTYENIADDQTFYAVWARDINGPLGIADGTPDYKQYRVLYDKNGGKGETIDTNIYSAGTTDIPVKDNGNMYNPGYVFVGWSINDNGGVPFADSTEMNAFETSYEIYRPLDNATVDIVSSNLTLYALWGEATKFPIELVEFRNDCADQGIGLRWTTATETYNEYFTLSRSENGVDFYEIARIAGAGTANDYLTYTYTDLTAEKEILYYYRLTQTDFDGTSANMGTITALCEKGTEKATELRIYPNPTRDILNVEVYNTASAEIEFVLYAATGMEVRHYTEAVAEGKHTCVLHLNNLTPGVYYLQQVGSPRSYKVVVER